MLERISCSKKKALNFFCWMIIYLFFPKDIVQGNADLAEHLIEILVDRDDVLAVRYWSKID